MYAHLPCATPFLPHLAYENHLFFPPGRLSYPLTPFHTLVTPTHTMHQAGSVPFAVLPMMASVPQARPAPVKSQK